MLNALNPLHLIVIVAAFGLVVSLWLAVLLFVASRRRSTVQKLQERLGLDGQENKDGRVLRLWREGKEATTIAPGDKIRLNLPQRLERTRQLAGLEAPVQTLLLGAAGAVAVLFLIPLLLAGTILGGLGLAVAAILMMWVYVRRRVNSNMTIFERQLADAMGLASRSLRAGHPILTAFRLISREIASPVGNVFAGICDRQGLGVPFEDTLRQAAEESHHPDMRVFATSVIIQQRSGGNLADMMDRLAEVIRDRIRLTWRFRVLTAQTQFSKWLLAALPFLLFATLHILNPSYLKPLYSTSLGCWLLSIAAVLLVSGVWLIGRMSVLKY